MSFSDQNLPIVVVNQISPKLDTKHPRERGIQFCSNEGQGPFTGEIMMLQKCIDEI